MFTYRQTEPNLWTVGTYDGGEWGAESDHSTAAAAADRVAYLNGAGLTEARVREIVREEMKRQKAAEDFKIIPGYLGEGDSGMHSLDPPDF